MFTSSTYGNTWLCTKSMALSYPIIINYIFSSLVNVTSVFEETHFQLLWLLYVAFSILILASLFGNSVIIHIIRTDNSMRTTTNYLILSQACADLVITIAEMMDVIHYSSMKKLWFGGLLGLITCNLCLLILFCPAMFSVWILATIAIERFYAVARPLQSSHVSKHLKKIIFLLLVFCTVISLLSIDKENLQIVKESYYCNLAGVLEDFTILKILSVSLSVPLPLGIILVMYIVVCLKLWSREVPGDGSNQNVQQAEAVKTARKVTLMMIAIGVLYMVCWFPLFAVGILQLLLSSFRVNGSILLFIIWLTVAYSALNPYVYLMFSQNFRKGFKRVLKNCLRRGSIGNLNVLPLRAQCVEIEGEM